MAVGRLKQNDLIDFFAVTLPACGILMHFDAFWWHKIPGGIKFRCMLVTFLGWPQYVGSQVAWHALFPGAKPSINHPVASIVSSKQPQTSFCMPEQTCTWSCIGCDKDEVIKKNHSHGWNKSWETSSACYGSKAFKNHISYCGYCGRDFTESVTKWLWK